MTAQIGNLGQNEYMMNDLCGEQRIDEVSPRGKNLEKMNVMNFIKNGGKERFGSTESDQKDY